MTGSKIVCVVEDINMLHTSTHSQKVNSTHTSTSIQKTPVFLEIQKPCFKISSESWKKCFLSTTGMAVSVAFFLELPIGNCLKDIELQNDSHL